MRLNEQTKYWINFMVGWFIIALLIWNLTTLYKNPQMMRECGIKYVNGTTESTGLYGNCQYLDKCLVKMNMSYLEQSKIKVNILYNAS